MRHMTDRQFNVSITAGTVIKTVGVLALAWLLYLIRDVVLIVLTAIVISSAIEPGVNVLRKRRIPRTIAVILIYLVLASLFVTIFYFFLPSVLRDFATFITLMPTYLEALGRAEAVSTYSQILGLPSPTDISPGDLMASVREALNISAFGNAFSAVSQIFGGVFSFILIVVFSFYFAVVDTGVDDFLRVVSPKSHQAYVLGLWRRSQHKIGLWMQGQLLLAIIVGVLVFLSLTIFNVPHALVLAVIAAVFEIIPVFGPVLAAVPAVAIGFISGGMGLGITVIIIYVVVQQFENHLIYPLVVTRVVGVPPLLVILGLIIGAELAGFLGIILSVPVAATLQELVRDIEAGRLPRKAE
jgi:predicted PurR-regulated permease PerM